MSLQRKYTAKVYDQDGSTKLCDFTFGQEGENLIKTIPSFQSTINGGLGEMVLDLKLPFDDFDEGTNVAFMNIVDLWVIDDDNPRGRRVYRGFISKYAPYFEGGDEGVRVTCLGLVSLLTTSFYKSGSTYAVTHTTQDPTILAKAVLDHYNTIYGGSLLSYDSSSIPSTVGTTVSVTFTDQRWSEAIQKIVELSGEGWWWHVDENGKLNFKAKPGSATHTFTIGKEIESIEGTKDSEKVVNDVQVRGASSATADDDDATSQATYGTGSSPSGKRSQIVSDSSLTDTNALTQRAAKEIADNKDAKVQSPFTVNTNYDLESIKVGDTCKITNIKKGNTFFNSNMLIVGLIYDGDTVRIEVEQLGANLGREITSLIGNTNTASGVSGGVSSGSGTSVTFVDETPTGSVNGSNTAFTLSQTPVSGSLQFFIGGVRMSSGGVDFSLSGTTITCVTAPALNPDGTTPVLRASYATGGSTTFYDETPSGSVNGSNVTFTLAHTPLSGSLQVFLGGVRMTSGGTDFSLSGTTITFVTAPNLNPDGTTPVLVASYAA